MDELGQLDPTDPETQYRRPSSQTTIPPEKCAPASCTLPERFGRYRVVRCLGQGAMGSVYLANDTQLDRPVALKIPKFAADGDTELIERFYREARSAATLRHANLCPVYDAGEIDGARYLSMAFIDGRPLSEVLAENGSPSQRDVATIILKLAKALDAAHSSGVIHRDLKPANIMIDRHDEPIVMDFGLARRINKDDSRLTQDGLLMGSPAYMSPEQVEGDIDQIGPASDIYSLGVIFYELLVGCVPFQGSIASVMGQVMSAMPKAPSMLKPGIDPALEAICMRMIAKRPEDRFASMRDVAAALEAYFAGRPTEVVIRKRVPIHHAQASLQSHGHARGLFIPTWMAITGVVVLLAAFGITWQLIATVMKQQALFDAPTREALNKGEAKLVLNGKAFSPDEMSRPIELRNGENTLVVEQNGVTTKEKTILVPEGDTPHFLVDLTKPERLPRVVATWVLTSGGTLKLEGSDTVIKDVNALPSTNLQLVEIDLSNAKKIRKEDILLIGRVGDSLKRLVIPNDSPAIDTLKQKRPKCSIELVAPNPGP